MKTLGIRADGACVDCDRRAKAVTHDADARGIDALEGLQPATRAAGALAPYLRT